MKENIRTQNPLNDKIEFTHLYFLDLLLTQIYKGGMFLLMLVLFDILALGV